MLKLLAAAAGLAYAAYRFMDGAWSDPGLLDAAAESRYRPGPSVWEDAAREGRWPR